MSQKKPLLLETIRIDEGKIINLSYHQMRFDKSREAHFRHVPPLQLSSLIDPPKQEGVFRCRILYTDTVEDIEYLPYTPKKIEKLKIVQSDIAYPYKYANRHAFETLLKTYPEYDDILIEKNDLITDTTIANIAFFDGEQWITPKKPLLEGTMRAKFIDKGFIHPYHVAKEDIKNFTHVALMNAMIGFKILNNVTIT